jgi:predicted dehydrogenase
MTICRALRRIRTTVIGLGGISFEHLTKLRRLPSVEIAGVCDLSQTLVDAVAQRFAVPGRYTSFNRMLDELRPDAVHVLTPPQTHRELVLRALDAGAHVFVEKPAALNWQDYVEMRDRAAERGLLLLENLNYRTMPIVTRVLEARDSGALGDVVNADVSMGLAMTDPGSLYLDPDTVHFAHSLPGGALRNFVSHPASVVVALVGAPRSVCVSQRRLHPSALGNDELRALVAGERGSATITVTSNGKPSNFTLRVQGTRATMDGDVFGGRLQAERVGSPLVRIADGGRRAAAQLSSTLGTVARTVGGRNYWFVGFERLVSDFYDAIRAGSGSPIPVAEMDAANQLVAELFEPGNQL